MTAALKIITKTQEYQWIKQSEKWSQEMVNEDVSGSFSEETEQKDKQEWRCSQM